MEQKKKNSILYRAVICILLAVIIFSLYKIGTIIIEYHEGTQGYRKLQSVAEAEPEKDLQTVNFKALQEVNPDVKAWLHSEDTVINYPVVQGEDNQYYLYRTAAGEWNSKGSLFIDYRCERPFRDFNTIIYGHRMKDGSMFHSLTGYEKKSYYEAHPVMDLLTPKHKYEVEIFGVVRIPADSPMYRVQFSGEDERQAYLNWIEENSLIDIDVRVNADDRLLMMSTCTYEFEDARLVVYGKLVEKI